MQSHRFYSNEFKHTYIQGVLPGKYTISAGDSGYEKKQLNDVFDSRKVF